MTDPICAVIDAHRFADSRWVQCNEEAKRIAPPVDLTRLPLHDPSANDNATNEYDRKYALAETLFSVASEAAARLFMVTPTTVAGALALLNYVTEREANGDELLLFDNLSGPHRRSSVALCYQLIEVLGRVSRQEP